MRRRGARDESLLVRAVGRAPVGVRTKLLVAFAGIAALLVVVAVLGLRVLGQSNARVATLGTLQLRAAAYQALQAQAQQLRQLLSIRAAQDPNLSVYVGVPATYVGDGRRWTLVDLTIAAALSQLLPATNVANFGFAPAARDKPLLRRVALDAEVEDEGAVVVPGTRPLTNGRGKDWGLAVATPVIVKYRDDRTDARTALEDAIR